MLDFRPELVSSFIEEMGEYLEQAESVFSSSDDGDVRLDELIAIFQNIKGLADMVGLSAPGRASKLLVDFLFQAGKKQPVDQDELAERYAPIRAALTEMLDEIRKGNYDQTDLIWERLREEQTAAFEELPMSLPPHLSRELLDIFLAEAEENLIGVRQAMKNLLENPQSSIDSNKLFSYLINLKGAAAMVNQRELGGVLVMMVEMMEAAERKKYRVDDNIILFWNKGLDFLERSLKLLGSNETDLSEYYEDFRRDIKDLLPKDLALSGMRSGLHTKAYVDTAHPEMFDEAGFQDQLRKVFRIEGQEHLTAMAQMIVEAERGDDSPDLIDRLFRAIHTLKGASATVGFQQLSQAAHQLENLLDEWRESGREVEEKLIGLLYDAERILRQMLDLPEGDEGRAARLVHNLNESISRFYGELPSEKGETRSSGAGAVPTESTAQMTDSLASRTVRVSINRLNRMMNMVSELNSYRNNLDDITAELGGQSKKLKWERRNMDKVMGDFHRNHQWELPVPGLPLPEVGEFSDLELDRYSDMAVFSRNIEDLNFKVGSIIKNVEELMNVFSEESSVFNALISSIKDEMVQARMVPMDSLFRQVEFQTMKLARALGKKVKVITYGGSTEIDKGIVEDLADPMMHIIRNCLDHGFESPELREKAGKPTEGVLRLSAVQEERSVIIRIDDDGAGIDVKAIGQAAVELNILSPEELEKKGDEDLINLIFFPRISTRESVDGLSGRGVGMDVVRHAISEMYGSIQVDSSLGEGTRFTLKLPLTLAVQPILTVRCDPHSFNLPMHYVEKIVESDDVVATGDENNLLLSGTEEIPLRWLSGFFRMEHDQETAGHPAVILRNGDRYMALLVDAVTDHEEVIVRPLSPLMESCMHFLGATVTGDGVVRLVLNIPFLFEMDDSLPILAVHDFEPKEHVKVLLADDSLSVRQTIKFMLTRHGIKANTAKDGLVAWQKLHGIKPDIMIVDLEMPNLNGFELMERVRQDPEFSHLPMLVLTSRGGVKHHQKAMSYGADGFLTKPTLEREIISRIRGALPPALRNLMDARDPLLSG